MLRPIVLEKTSGGGCKAPPEAATGLCLLSDLKVLDMSRVWIIPTFLWPQLIGGALFGLGFLVSGTDRGQRSPVWRQGGWIR